MHRARRQAVAPRERPLSITLTITRPYFDLIAAGTKTVEYRRDARHYHALFAGPSPRYLVLHYRSGRYLLCRVRRIRYRRRPARLAASVFITTPWCFGIEIERAIGPLPRASVVSFLQG